MGYILISIKSYPNDRAHEQSVSEWFDYGYIKITRQWEQQPANDSNATHKTKKEEKQSKRVVSKKIAETIPFFVCCFKHPLLMTRKYENKPMNKCINE